MPTIAFRATAGASAQISRDLHDGRIDIGVLYDPVFRREIVAEKLFDDCLVMVTGGEPAEWEANYARIDWGSDLAAEMSARLGIAPATGLVLDLGMQAATWLLAQRMAGFMPKRLVRDNIEVAT